MRFLSSRHHSISSSSLHHCLLRAGPGAPGVVFRGPEDPAGAAEDRARGPDGLRLRGRCVPGVHDVVRSAGKPCSIFRQKMMKNHELSSKVYERLAVRLSSPPFPGAPRAENFKDSDYVQSNEHHCTKCHAGKSRCDDTQYMWASAAQGRAGRGRVRRHGCNFTGCCSCRNCASFLAFPPLALPRFVSRKVLG